MNRFYWCIVSTACVFAFFPFVAHAASNGTGFVLNTPLWYTRDVGSKGAVRAYSVVVNNDYRFLDATVGFYANTSLIGTASIQHLARNSAQEIYTDWIPDPGSYVISARFILAVVTDDSGAQHIVTLPDITSANGASLVVNAGVAGSAQSTPASASGAIFSNGGGIGSATIVIPPDNQSAGSSSGGARGGSSGSAAISSGHPSGGRNSGQGYAPSDRSTSFAKNRDAIARALQDKKNIMADSAGVLDESSPLQATGTYQMLLSAIDKGKNFIAQAPQELTHSKPYATRLRSVWNVVSDNNSPKRILILIAGVFVLKAIIGFYRRHRRRM